MEGLTEDELDCIVGGVVTDNDTDLKRQPLGTVLDTSPGLDDLTIK